MGKQTVKRRINHIMEPLDVLADGAERIRKNDMTQDIEYSGDAEFVSGCMRGSVWRIWWRALGSMAF